MKKILLVVFSMLIIFQLVVMAVVINIGSEAEDRASSTSSGNTIINLDNPATVAGTITSVEIWAYVNLSGVEVATFYAIDATHYTTRDNQAIANITAGAKRVIPVSLHVEIGDFIGMYWTGGNMERDTSGFDGFKYVAGDNIPCNNVEFPSVAAGDTLSLKGIGTTANAINFAINF